MEIKPSDSAAVNEDIRKCFGVAIEATEALYREGVAVLVDGAAKAYDESQRLVLPRLAPMMLARGLTALRAGTRLFEQGFEAEASTVSRTITELAIDSAWLSRQTDSETVAKRYVAFYYVDFERLMATLDKHAPTAEGTMQALFGVAPFDEMRKGAAAAIADHGYKAHGGWSTKSIGQRAREADLGWVYDLVYGPLSSLVHSSMGSVTVFSGPGGQLPVGARLPTGIGVGWLSGSCVALLTTFARCTGASFDDEAAMAGFINGLPQLFELGRMHTVGG